MKGLSNKMTNKKRKNQQQKNSLLNLFVTHIPLNFSNNREESLTLLRCFPPLPAILWLKLSHRSVIENSEILRKRRLSKNFSEPIYLSSTLPLAFPNFAILIITISILKFKSYLFYHFIRDYLTLHQSFNLFLFKIIF